MAAPLRVSLSTSSVYPGTTASGFEAASRLGYDGVEVMVGIDALSQQTAAVRQLSEHHGIPICAIHAPTFRWQREYAKGFVEGIAELEDEHGLVFAVENMYPWRTGKREFHAYLPDWNPVGEEYAHVTLDLSHSATAADDPVAMARELGERLAHVHLADSTGSPKDEHLVPGRGTQPCAEFLHEVAASSFSGEVVVEVSTRKAADLQEREADLLEALAFAREHAAR